MRIGKFFKVGKMFKIKKLSKSNRTIEKMEKSKKKEATNLILKTFNSKLTVKKIRTTKKSFQHWKLINKYLENSHKGNFLLILTDNIPFKTKNKSNMMTNKKLNDLDL